jgi:hypothetical protein
VHEFLDSVAQPSSALADDIKILDYVAEKSGIFAAAPPPPPSFSTGSEASASE